MTEATARPMMDMEAQLAGTRANYLGNLQGLSYNNLQGAYNNAGQLAGQFAGLGANAMANQGQMYSGLASLQGQMSQPEYWQPQYEKQPGLFDYLGFGVGLASLFV